nr:hypothetical protein [Tanacetum cinerariifolium]
MWVKYQLILKTHPFSLNHHPLNLRGSTNPERSRGRKLRTNQAAKIEKLKKRVKKLEGKKKNRTHGLKRMNDKDLFGVNDLDGDEVIVDVTGGENVKHDVTVAKKEVSVAADEVVTTAESVEGKEIMVKLEKPLKKKDQIVFDEEVTRKLDAQMKAKMEEEEMIAREKDEANRTMIEEWDDYFAAKRAEEIKNKPPTKAQQKSLMCNYMKNMEGYKQKDFKGKSFDAIKKMFDKVYKRVNTFMAMDSEVMEGSKKTQAELTEGSSKRERDEIEQESAKRQRLEKEDDTTELKRCLEIVPKDDDDVTIEATPYLLNLPPQLIIRFTKKGRKVTSKSLGQMKTHKTI